MRSPGSSAAPQPCRQVRVDLDWPRSTSGCRLPAIPRRRSVQALRHSQGESMDAVAPAALAQSIASDRPPLVIDVRRQERFLDSEKMIAGALRRDPAKVADWKQTLPAQAQVVVYCVHGHEVSQDVAKALGARYLEGGIEAWEGPFDPKPRSG